MLKVTNEKTENSQVFLTIEMEPAEVEESLEEAFRRLVKRTRVPGFREGKAPRAILERHIGRDRLFQDALNNLLPQAYERAIKEQAIEAIAQPQIEVTQAEPLVFKAIVPLKPKVKLGDYQHIQMAPETVTVTEDDVNAVMEQLRHQYATWEPVERAVDFDDFVVLDIESGVGDKPFVNQKGGQYQVLQGLSFPAPGFREQLVGMKRNEEKEFKLQLPADLPQGELAGKESWFKVRITEIKQEILPELNDQLAGEVNPDLKTLDALRERVASDLKLNVEEKAGPDFEERVIDAVADLAEVEFPPILVEVETNRILNQYFQRSSQKLEEYLSSLGKTEEVLREELRPLATKEVKRSLVLGKAAEAEKIEVSSSEIDSEIANMTQSAGENKGELEKMLNTPQARQSIEQRLIIRKTIQRLVEIAKATKKTKRTKRKKEGK